MEFFASVPVTLTVETLQRRLGIDQLPGWCASIDKVLESRNEKGAIYCIWGEFRIRREVIRDGLRFTLPGCPNALQWTVTAENGEVVVHLTINRQRHDADFIESIEQFVGDWKSGIVSAVGKDAPSGPSCRNGRCTDSFSGFG